MTSGKRIQHATALPNNILRLGMLLTGVLMAACSSSADGALEDAGVTADDAFTLDDAGTDAAADDGGTGGGQTLCDPRCGSAQVCCVDEHGHLPRCVDGSECSPPLQWPPDGG